MYTLNARILFYLNFIEIAVLFVFDVLGDAG